jgi:predicted phosphodiesterase
MRLAVLADIHSNLIALQAVLDDLRHLGGADGIIVAGDSLGSGPHPAETLTLLRDLPAHCWIIRGNREEYLLAHRDDPMPGQQWAALRWTLERLTDEAMAYVAGLPAQCALTPPGLPGTETAALRVVHGSPRSVSEALIPDDETIRAMYRRSGLLNGRHPPPLDEVLAGINEAVLVCAHTHMPWQYRRGERMALNPGSVGEPTNRDPRAHYALLDWRDGRWHTTHHAVAYDLDRLREDYYRTGLLAAGGAFSRACLLACERGIDIAGWFVAYARRLAAEAGVDQATIPDEIWARAEATYDWAATSPPDGGTP